MNDILIDDKLLKELLSNDLYCKIISSRTFNRLKKISFLGAIDYINPTKKKFYRYEHSISVATLGLQYAKLKKLNQKDTDLLVVSALLHDIGHAPLSHSIENSFSNKYNINHHTNGNNIIKGNSIFSNEIKIILNNFDIDENYIVKILDGEVDDEMTFALTNPINIDTIDGINRCYLSMNYSNKYQKLGFIYKTTDIVRAIVDKNEVILNSFWELKNRMYKDFIHHPLNLYADFFASEFAKQISLSKDDFNIDDKKLKNRYDKLFVSLSSLNYKTIEEKIRYKKREYTIEKNTLRNSTDISRKYTSSKYISEIFVHQEYKVRKEQSLWQ